MKTKSIFIFSFFILVGAFIISNYFFSSNFSEINESLLQAEKENVVMVYIGSSTCNYSNDKRLPSIVENIKSKVLKLALSENKGFTTIGIAIDWNIQDGFNHLNKIGNFNEILVGNNWFNHGSSKYFFNDSLSIPGTPQILLIKRSYSHHDKSGENSISYKISSDSLISKFVGIEDLIKWDSVLNQTYPKEF